MRIPDVDVRSPAGRRSPCRTRAPRARRPAGVPVPSTLAGVPRPLPLPACALGRMFPRMTHVRMYMKQGCPYSAGAKRLLDERGIDYEEIDLVEHPDRHQEMIRLTGGRSTVPQIFFGETHVGGYGELAEYDRRRGIRTLLHADDATD